MSGTFLCPNTCGFRKIVALELSKEIGKSLPRAHGKGNSKYKARVLQEQYRQFKSFFEPVSGNFDIDYKQFTKKLPSLKDAVSKWSRVKLAEKKKYLETFSRANWVKLSESRKREHTFANCKSCSLRHADVQAIFPVKSAVLKAKTLANPVFVAHDESERKGTGNILKPTQQLIKDTAKAIYDKVAPAFQKQCGVPLSEGLSKVTDMNLQYKTANDRRKDRRYHYSQVKINIENQMSETAFNR